MSGVKEVTQLDDDSLVWVAEIMGVRRQWTARILEQVPDEKVAWAATEGATNAGAVTFQAVGAGQTSVHLSLEYEPEGLLEGLADKLHLVEKQAEGDLARFKAFIESEGHATGTWRGSVDQGAPVGTPDLEDAAQSRGDSGKAGVSGIAVAAGAAVLAAGTAAVVTAANAGGDSSGEEAYPVTESTDPGEPITTYDPSSTISPSLRESQVSFGTPEADSDADAPRGDDVTGASGT